jgi:hypothetical protein
MLSPGGVRNPRNFGEGRCWRLAKRIELVWFGDTAAASWRPWRWKRWIVAL